MSKKMKPKFGKLPPLYRFSLNPYPGHRFSRCPFCERKTGQRKLPLFIHVNPNYPIALNYTCRYCKQCDLLIAHKIEIERLLTTHFKQLNHEVIGNEYLIIGTVEKKAWQENSKHPKEPKEMLSQIHDFKTVYSEIRMTRPGWYDPGQEPQVMEPPQSSEWIK
jgi:hypothetical protein